MSRNPYHINWDDGSRKEFHPVRNMLKALFFIFAAVALTVAMRGL